MKISELIVELEKQKELHGDVEVDIMASYDCHYAVAGGTIDDITFGKVSRYKYENGKYVPHSVDGITLENNEG